MVTSVHFSSVAQSCLTLCDPMDWRTLGFPVHHQSLLKLMFMESVMPSNRLNFCHPFSRLQSFPASESFPKSQFFASGGQSIGAQWLQWRYTDIDITDTDIFQLSWWLSSKESVCTAGDLGLIPGSGRSPEGRHGNPLQYSYLENPMDGGAWQAVVHWVAQSQTRLKQLSSNNIDIFPGGFGYRGFSGGSDSKESAFNAGDQSLTPGSGRSPGERNGYLLQYFCLENPMDRWAWPTTVHGVTKSQTWLRN